MKIENLSALKHDEKAIFALRELYDRYGYTRYKMSKFEEYELYVSNKNFLISDHIITFNDASGKLMALKPDVTLSIVKHTKDNPSYVQKVYYNENVYRADRNGYSFREIMQVGLECIGAIDHYCISEVLMLAVESLAQISEDFVLDISHLGILSSVLDRFEIRDRVRASLLHCFAEKNVHGLGEICTEEGISEDAANCLKRLSETYGTVTEVLPVLREMMTDENGKNALSELQTVLSVLQKSRFSDRVRLDFSVINDLSYYNGIVFRGFVNGIPTGILSGGQYDLLMQKMGKKAGAIGFAVYPDSLEELVVAQREYDVDALLLYDDTSEPDALYDAVRLLTDSGKRVVAQRNIPEKLRYKQLLRLKERGVEILENHA